MNSGNQHQFHKLAKGFALTDLIASMALIGIAVSVFLPAIQSAREASRLNVCENRLALIGIDTQFYHDVHGRLPMALGAQGTVGWNEWTSVSSGNYWGWQQNTSPIALAASVSTNFDIEPIAFDFTTTMENSGTNGSNRYFWNLDGWVERTSQNQARYLCPALSRLNNAQPSLGVVIGHQPVTLDGAPDAELAILFASSGATYGRSNYAGCLGADAGYVEEFSM